MNRYWTSINKDIPRIESYEKVTGQGKYTDDLSLPGMVYGAILHSPYAYAKVKSIDCSCAMKLEGVLTVLLPDEVEDILYNSSGNPPSDLLFDDERILTDNPLFVGDRILAVAAITPELCHRAISLIKLEYEIFEPILTIEKALKDDAPLIHPEICNSNVIDTIKVDHGNVDDAFLNAYIVLEDTFKTPPINCAPLEPTGCICDYGEDEINVISTSQTPFQERRLLAKIFKFPESKVRVTKPVMGGGFGSRQQLHHQPVGVYLSKKVGKPVKMIFTREEETLSTTVRHSSKIHIKMAADREGNITAFDVQSYHDTGAYITHGLIILSAQSKKTPYNIPNYRYRGHCVYTNNLTAGAMRGYGNPQLTFAREVMVDRIAKELNISPLEIRIKNMIKTGDLVAGTKTHITSCELLKCIDEAFKIKNSLFNDFKDKEENWGMAIAMHTSGPSNKTGLSSAIISVNDDGSVILKTGSADIGQGSETALSQVALETLGIDLNKVTVVSGDTLLSPYDTGTFASSQMFVAGNAVLNAAYDVIFKLKEALSKVLNVDSNMIKWDNYAFKVGEEDVYSFVEAVKITYFTSPIIGSASYKAIEAPPVFAVCLVRMIQDPLTYVLNITDIIETVDVGTVINKNIVKGQIEGGVLQGLGYGIMEQMQNDIRTKRPITSDFLLYKIPTSLDMPNIHGCSVESYDSYGPYGAKSVGELTIVPVAAAIANCVSNLTKDKINELPLSNKYIIRCKGGEK